MEKEFQLLRGSIETDRRTAELYEGYGQPLTAAIYRERADAFERIMEKFEEMRKDLEEEI